MSIFKYHIFIVSIQTNKKSSSDGDNWKLSQVSSFHQFSLIFNLGAHDYSLGMPTLLLHMFINEGEGIFLGEKSKYTAENLVIM